MAAKTPATGPETTGYVDPHRGVWTGESDSNSMLSNGKIAPGREGMRLQIFFFDGNIDNLDTWTSGISNIRAVAWQPETGTTDHAAAFLFTQSTGAIGFVTENNGISGWLWVLSGGSG